MLCAISSEALLLSHFSCFQLCVTPETAAHQAPPSLGFSRQEHWSRLPFPFPMHESEKWKWSRSVVSDSSRPHGRQSTRLLLHPCDFPGKSTGVGCHCLLQVLCVFYHNFLNWGILTKKKKKKKKKRIWVLPFICLWSIQRCLEHHISGEWRGKDELWWLMEGTFYSILLSYSGGRNNDRLVKYIRGEKYPL